MAKFNHIDFIKGLLKFSPRQLEGETAAGKYIISVLNENDVDYSTHDFEVLIPRFKKAVLFADGKKVKCIGTGYIGGKIEGKESLVSSLIPSRFLIEKSNINFNPRCESEISCSNFYFAPSVAVSREDVPKILSATKVRGEVDVDPVKHKAFNILVGNRINPKNICFAHYDSVNLGAIDNASGVAVVMGAILAKPQTLADTLYIFAANEELSYDKPTYWGHGFRAFEEDMGFLLNGASKIFVIDSLGNAPTQITEDPGLVYLAFPLKDNSKYAAKTRIVYGSIDDLLNVYHSDADDIKKVKAEYLAEGVERLLSAL